MDKATFLELIQANKGILYKIGVSYCRNASDREDLIQEMVYQLWKSADRFDDHFKFSTWMYRIALNVAISFYRKSNAHGVRVELGAHIESGFWDPADASASASVSAEGFYGPEGPLAERIDVLQRFIASLGELDKALMILYLEERSYKEIADVLGLTETNVATKLSRIKGRLKQHFLTIGGRGSAV